jgi:U32 family peptidase
MTVDLASARVVAPVASTEDAAAVMAAGAHELYCGAMFDDWTGIFGEADLVSRRQGRLSHVTSRRELRRLARFAADHHCPIALTLNARYSHLQQDRILELVRLWEDAGGSALLVGEPALLDMLQHQQRSLQRHLSIMANVFNGAAIQFFRQLGVSRIVLPRELALTEIRRLTDQAPDLEFEMLAMLQKCQFIDGMCGFYHGICLPPDQPACFDYSPGARGAQVAARLIDPAYEGHGCRLAYRTHRGPVIHAQAGDDRKPACAACLLTDLLSAGVRYFKIAGRGYGAGRIASVVRFVLQALEIHRCNDAATARETIQSLYADYFGRVCEEGRCYYDAGPPPQGGTDAGRGPSVGEGDNADGEGALV